MKRIPLPSAPGATATVSDDCPPAVVDALDKMVKAVKNHMERNGPLTIDKPRRFRKKRRKPGQMPRMRLKKHWRPDTETLERLKRWPSLQRKFAGQSVRIYSGEHEGYWGPNGGGYFSDGLSAGIYLFEDAFRRTHHAGPEKRVEFRLAKPVGTEPTQ